MVTRLSMLLRNLLASTLVLDRSAASREPLTGGDVRLDGKHDG
jgi:hypothetical protein